MYCTFRHKTILQNIVCISREAETKNWGYIAITGAITSCHSYRVKLTLVDKVRTVPVSPVEKYWKILNLAPFYCFNESRVSTALLKNINFNMPQIL